MATFEKNLKCAIIIQIVYEGALSGNRLNFFDGTGMLTRYSLQIDSRVIWLKYCRYGVKTCLQDMCLLSRKRPRPKVHIERIRRKKTGISHIVWNHTSMYNSCRQNYTVIYFCRWHWSVVFHIGIFLFIYRTNFYKLKNHKVLGCFFLVSFFQVEFIIWSSA